MGVGVVGDHMACGNIGGDAFFCAWAFSYAARIDEERGLFDARFFEASDEPLRALIRGEVRSFSARDVVKAKSYAFGGFLILSMKRQKSKRNN